MKLDFVVFVASGTAAGMKAGGRVALSRTPHPCFERTVISGTGATT